MEPVVVRFCSPDDLSRLERSALPADALAHHRERCAMQQRGEARYLLGWSGGTVVGRVTLLHASKYAGVRERGALWEMNALEAVPQGRGVGTLLITAAEELARVDGPGVMGLAAEPSNTGALRLYGRLGYRDWGDGLVLDEWTERDSAGRVLREHRTPCRYLLKSLTG
ncbi:MAG: GNAT family N-acetyltransferase [Oryzihumus sp.]